jgi:hypothetical protein
LPLVVVFVAHNFPYPINKNWLTVPASRVSAANPKATNLADNLVALQIQCGSAFFSAVAATAAAASGAAAGEVSAPF